MVKEKYLETEKKINDLRKMRKQKNSDPWKVHPQML